MIKDSEIVKLLRALHLALHSLEEKGGIQEEAELSDHLEIKIIKK